MIINYPTIGKTCRNANHWSDMILFQECPTCHHMIAEPQETEQEKKETFNSIWLNK